MAFSFGFIPYLTVFQSRLGSLNVVLSCAAEQSQQREQISRRMARSLFSSRRLLKSDGSWGEIIAYLNSKGQLGKKAKSSGPYRGLRLTSDGDVVDVAGKPTYEVAITQADLWMSDLATRSTVGAPTEPNLDEYCNLAVALGLLSSSTNSVRPLGRASVLLRQYVAQPSTPFAIGIEGVVFLRSIIAADGAVMLPFAEQLASIGPSFTRDSASDFLPVLYSGAIESLRQRRAPAEVIRECRKAIEPVLNAAERRSRLRVAGSKESLGVLEHRTAPRLEWLVDLGSLAKPTSERNAFVYSATGDLNVLVGSCVREMGESDHLFAEECARRYFLRSSYYDPIRQVVSVHAVESAIATAYALLKRPVGPVVIRDLSLLAGILCKQSTLVTEFERIVRERGKIDSRVRLSGDRFSRDAVNVIIDQSLVAEWVAQGSPG
jgi:hypothetical protein